MKKEEIILTAILTAGDAFESTWAKEQHRYVYNTKNPFFLDYNKKICFTVREQPITPPDFYKTVFHEVSCFYQMEISMYFDAQPIYKFYLLKFAIKGNQVCIPKLKKDETITFAAIDWSIARFLSVSKSFFEVMQKLFLNLQ